MADTDQGPGTPLHSLPFFLAGWVLMLTAMMLPSELTYVGAFAALVRDKSSAATARVQPVICFIVGYALAWLAYGLLAYVLDYAVRSAALPGTAPDRSWPHRYFS
jgi:predicted metal-binding membrane protein